MTSAIDWVLKASDLSIYLLLGTMDAELKGSPWWEPRDIRLLLSKPVVSRNNIYVISLCMPICLLAGLLLT